MKQKLLIFLSPGSKSRTRWNVFALRIYLYFVTVVCELWSQQKHSFTFRTSTWLTLPPVQFQVRFHFLPYCVGNAPQLYSSETLAYSQLAILASWFFLIFQTVTFMTRVVGIPGSNPDRDIDYPYRILLWFLSVPLGNFFGSILNQVTTTSLPNLCSLSPLITETSLNKFQKI